MCEIVNDIVTFYTTVGGLDELSERDLVDLKDIHTKEYKKYLTDLCNKYDVEYENKGDLTDDILGMEILLDEYFHILMEKNYCEVVKNGY